MALEDTYEIRTTGTVLGVPFTIIWHALRTSGTYAAADVVGAWHDTLFTTMLANMSNDVTMIQNEIKSLGNALDFYSYGLGPTNGGDAGDTMPPFVAYDIKFPRLRTDMHHGRKRLPGVPEGSAVNGVLSSTPLSNMQAFADLIVGDWEKVSAPGTAVANFIIIKRVLDGAVYRLPETNGELVYYTPQTAVVNPNLSSQVSRKYGS